MSETPLLGGSERRLLEAATGLVGVCRVPELVERLRPSLEFEGERTLGGLGLHDEERDLFVYHALPAGEARLESIEIPAMESEARRFRLGQHRVFVLELATHASNPFLRTLAARGFSALASAPLFGGQRTLGTLFLGTRSGLPGAAQLDYLVQLAKIVEPHLWNCFTDERFARGDRRRDALREFSSVINSSLEPRVVLQRALAALAAMEGHRWSWIGLLDQGGEGAKTWRRHELGPGHGREPGEPAARRLADTIAARVIREERTYESGDLERAGEFDEDEELRGRGVRRYLATPLRAGGEILGALLFGGDEPRPALRVDVFLIENIALQVGLAVDNALRHEEIQRLSARRERENVYLREEIQSEHDARGMIGRSPAMRRVFEQIARVAPTDSSVLLSGPTGVGKELVARAIHEASRHKAQPMVKLNCAAMPEGMVESELFGHERGAFTSAVDRRIGRFELAHNGTLFLDEVGELPLGVQAKLLRVLQSGEFERVGGGKTLTSNARIIAATNRDLAKAMESGAFRSDLFYRLNVFPIAVPSLDERREDVPLLAQAFLEQLARRMGKRIDSIEPAALERLCARAWPGNVRELKHVIERAVILCDGPVLEIEAEVPPARQTARAAATPVLGHSTLEEIDAAHIRAALERTGGVVEGPRGAAVLLGLKGSTLRFRMKRLGIRRS